MAAAYKIDTTTDAESLDRRATALRAQADELSALEAVAFRRRAAELELEAWALRVRRGDDVALAA